MKLFNKILIPAFAIVFLLGASGGSAQQDSMGDTGLTVRQDDLDSFWLDTHNWYWYGYRPYTHVHTTRFAGNLPTWNTGKSGYSFGINEPAGNASWEGGPNVPFQLSKGGTWH
ncbi:MAG TPA: hypothetical protein VGP76_26245 [Planctomycetaceae bacterium]|jgi:hypothetical protein|nr:hypothetical protein [Planctomycetaceae bacterium]